jgi:hypothetical protein
MKRKQIFPWLIAGLALSATPMMGCSDNTSSSPAAESSGHARTLYTKYGGQATVNTVVSQVVAAVIADCSQNPYFTTVLDTNGHDTTDKLTSCLELYFNSALGGGATYPGISTYGNAPQGGYQCEDLTAIHAGLGITPDVFDQFVVDVSTVLKQNGVSDVDITTITNSLNGAQAQVVSPVNEQVTYDYTPENPVNNGCTASPSPSPSVSPSPSPSPSVSPAPSPSPSPSVAPNAGRRPHRS